MTYLPLFQSLANDTDWQLDGDNMLVEIFDQGEDSKEIVRADGSKASLVLTADTGTRQLGGFADRKPMLVRVLKVGRGYVKEDGTFEPIDLKPGAIAEVPKMAIEWRSRIVGLIVPENRVGYVTRSSALQTFADEAAYRRIEAATKGGGQ
jgi:hypothetical protein